MKKVFVILVLISVMAGCATMGADAPPEMMNYQVTIDVPGKSANELYVLANAWFVDQFRSAKSVIQFQDKESGVIKGRFVFTTYDGLATYLMASVITVEVRDGKCRFTGDNPSFGNASQGDSSIPARKMSMMEKFRTKWIMMSKSLEVSISKQSSSW